MTLPQIDFYDLMQAVLTLLMAGVGIGVRALHRELTGLREELHRYVLSETCRSKTEGIETRIARLESLEQAFLAGLRRCEEKTEVLNRMEDDGR